ncbi:lipoprotein [Cupriavidus necator N-1]|uniref:Outer membrane protein assembly factor BamE n=1 Tax=Cupriavidus necator (strain ATCC 43291 / DSM 13513 / CCUG 52238 / LMG 8453 / N-1) TaxID=1042878 RepID=G0EVY2_CUPNN|nr:outer membrane protein assembly factor BamE [Cupriavidus necator]AEI78410.1 lipoprotein [Cupriavidus necator N-1]MDX6013066.1 outer membrane protein assembly factor BamE [Cupriavidus necator]
MRSIRSSAMRPTLVVSLLAAALLAGACSAYDSTSRKVANAITPYRINIVQGNFVSREAVSQLREGMTRDQVKFLLGTPLLNDVFHADRWDYVFSFRRGNTPVVQQRRYTVYFEGDRLVKFSGDELPSEYELIAEIDGMKKALKDQTPGKISTGAPATAAAPAEPQTTVENFVPRQAQQPEAAPAAAASPAQATAPAEAPKPAAN